MKYEKEFNISVIMRKLPEKSKKIINYNKYMERFLGNFQLYDLAPGCIGGSCPKKFSKLMQKGLKIYIILFFGVRNNHRLRNRLVTLKTQENKLNTYIEVANLFEKEKDLNFIGFKFKEDNNYKEFILEELK